MKQITLEQWCAYLPHKVTAEILDYKSDYVGKQFDIIIGVNQWSKCGTLWSFETYSGAKHSADRIKPILRPLTDLTKEVEIDSEKFIPYHRMQEFILNRNFDGVKLYQNRINTNTLYYTDAQLLFKWHFDIFGLIDEGFAIDINTLNKK